jgi:benzoate transport
MLSRTAIREAFMTDSQDPRATLAAAPMSRFQIVAVAITIGLNALDGFDVLAISFAAPGIAAEWGIDRAALGVVLAMELLGMTAGSLLFGGLADRIGRRPTILGCLVLMTTGMLLCVTAGAVMELLAWRFLTGLGIGGMLAAINAMAAEYSNARNRDMAVSLMAAGYPIGAVVGGSLVAVLLRHYDWRSIFLLGGLITALFIPLVLWRVPESIAFLCDRRPAGVLERINSILRKMGQPTVAALPPLTAAEQNRSLADILRPGLLPVTILVTAAYFLHITTFYFILKWAPKIVVDMGFAAASAATVLVWANVGGATGSLVLSVMARRFPVLWLTLGVLVISTFLVTLFGFTGGSIGHLALVAAIAGFFTNSGVVGLYAIIARSFPTHVRATATGFVIGVGRGGAALSPVIAGLLFQAGIATGFVALCMAVGSLLAATALLFLHRRVQAAG